jgi:hypothetical protein
LVEGAGPLNFGFRVADLKARIYGARKKTHHRGTETIIFFLGRDLSSLKSFDKAGTAPRENHLPLRGHGVTKRNKTDS